MTNALEQAMTESPEDISKRHIKAFWDAKLWRPDGIVDGAEFIFKDTLGAATEACDAGLQGRLWVGNEKVIDLTFKPPANLDTCSHLDNDSGNGDCGFKMAYRVTGRATQAEEKHLRSIDKKSPPLLEKTPQERLAAWRLTGPTVAFGDLYQNWKKRFIQDGWSAFDNAEAELFDELHAEYSGAVIDGAKHGAFQTTFDIKPSVQAARDESVAKAGDKTLDEAFDKVDSNPYSLRPSRPFTKGSTIPVNDGVSRLKYFCGGKWQDVFSTGILAERPLRNQAILNDWRLQYPEEDYPDRDRTENKIVVAKGIIPEPWAKPDKPTRHAKDADELSVLLRYREQETSNEPLQTNVFFGDNDNNITGSEDDEPSCKRRDIESRMRMRPSEDVIMRSLPSVSFEKRMVTPTDALDGPNFRLVPIDGPDIERDETSRTVLEMERERAAILAAESASDFPAGRKAQHAERDTAARSAVRSPSPVCRMGHLRFNTADKDLVDRYSKHRGEMTQHFSNGKWIEFRDAPYEIPGASPAITKLNTLFDKELGAMRSTSNIRKWTPAERNKLEQKARARWARLGSDKLPALPDASKPMPVPSNDNAIRFGLPYDVVSASHLSMAAGFIKPNAKTGLTSKTQTSAAMIADSQEGILLRKQEKEIFGIGFAQLSADEAQAIESGAYAANYAQVGGETGDEGKSEKTKERNGKQRLLQAAAKYSAISERIAA